MPIPLTGVLVVSFWKNLAKVGLIAAPYVAAPFTGGASLALIGAGAGAAGAALGGGGVKGALLGGAVGAIPGAASAASPAAKTGIDAALDASVPEALRATAATPSVWSRIAANPQMWEAASKMVGAATQAAGQNRSSLRQAQFADYVASGKGPNPVSPQLRSRASDLEDELMKRLTPGWFEQFGTYAAPALGIGCVLLKNK
jgi:hypothetical protein